MIQYITSWFNVIGDGNCGFRVIADAFMRDQECWPTVRRSVVSEMQNEEFSNVYKTLWTESEYYQALERINYFGRNAPEAHWLEAPTDLYVIATFYNVTIVYLNTTGRQYRWNCTIPPLRAPPGRNSPVGILVFLRLSNIRHYIRLHLTQNCPLPPIPENWFNLRHDSVIGWEVPYRRRLEAWNRHIQEQFSSN